MLDFLLRKLRQLRYSLVIALGSVIFFLGLLQLIYFIGFISSCDLFLSLLMQVLEHNTKSRREKNKKSMMLTQIKIKTKFTLIVWNVTCADIYFHWDYLNFWKLWVVIVSCLMDTHLNVVKGALNELLLLNLERMKREEWVVQLSVMNDLEYLVAFHLSKSHVHDIWM